jgi:hypothetical protein
MYPHRLTGGLKMPTTRKRATKARKSKTSKRSAKLDRTRSGLEVSRLMNQLGATESFPVNVASDGPFGARALAAEIRMRLQSRGGRPSVPGTSMRRLVPMKKEVWQALKREALAASAHDRRISAGQLAAMLLEKHVMGSGGKP